MPAIWWREGLLRLWNLVGTFSKNRTDRLRVTQEDSLEEAHKGCKRVNDRRQGGSAGNSTPEAPGLNSAALAWMVPSTQTPE